MSFLGVARRFALTRLALIGLSRRRARAGAPSTSFAGERAPTDLVRDVRRSAVRRSGQQAVRALVVAAFALGSVSMALSTVGLTECDDAGGVCTTTTWYPLSVVKRTEIARDSFGLPHGTYREWFWHGQIAFEGAFVRGEKDGAWREWWPNGNVRFDGVYDDGAHIGDERWWYESGQQEWAGAWKNGLRHGQETWWYESGAVRQAGAFVDGRPSGAFEIFAPDGSRITSRTIHDDA